MKTPHLKETCQHFDSKEWESANTWRAASVRVWRNVAGQAEEKGQRRADVQTSGKRAWRRFGNVRLKSSHSFVQVCRRLSLKPAASYVGR